MKTDCSWRNFANPDEIQAAADIPKAPAEWRESAATCAPRSTVSRRARILYAKGWEALSAERHEPAIILTDRALCCFNAGDFKSCARLAGCAWHLDPAYKKAGQLLEEGLNVPATRVCSSFLPAHHPGMSCQGSSRGSVPCSARAECYPQGLGKGKKQAEDVAESQGLGARPCSLLTSGQRQGPSTTKQ